MPTLKRGSRGREVERLQLMLNRLGCGSLTIDGNFGGATEKAVEDFQRKHGLDPDGKFGGLSQAAMEPYINQAIGVLTRSCIAMLQRSTDFQHLEVLLDG